jgi:hypothetical protein
MMGGGAFILLKAGRNWPESAKQAKIRLAILLKILYTPVLRAKFLRHGRRHMRGLCRPEFLSDMANLPGIADFVI